MDLISNRTKAIGQMALDGLYERSKAIASNTANALTPNYKRKEVSFEESLRKVIQGENEKEQIKLQNAQKINDNLKVLGQSPAQIALLNSDLLNSDIKDNFAISVETDNQEAYSVDGNNVNIEAEMMDEAKTGMQYQVIAGLMAKSYSDLRSIISGNQGQ